MAKGGIVRDGPGIRGGGAALARAPTRSSERAGGVEAGGARTGRRDPGRVGVRIKRFAGPYVVLSPDPTARRKRRQAAGSKSRPGYAYGALENETPAWIAIRRLRISRGRLAMGVSGPMLQYGSLGYLTAL